MSLAREFEATNPPKEDNGDRRGEPTVFVVDDDAAIRKSLTWLIESVGLRAQTFSSAQQFLDDYEPDSAGCLVLDVRMPGMSGLELQSRLREQEVDLPVIIVTGYGDVPMAVRAVQSGATHFLEKPVGDQVLLDYIRKAIERDAELRTLRSQNSDVIERLNRLTDRERQVLDCVVKGMASREIAAHLGVSIKTIDAHRSNLMKKMEAKTVPHLVHMCMRAAPGYPDSSDP